MQEFKKQSLTNPWELALVEKYPLVFIDESNPDNTHLRYGFECGAGWSSLIEEIAKKATEIIAYLRSTGDTTSYIRSCIVKEKFGTLHWQGDHHLPPLFSDLWCAYVSRVERRSASVCERTGRYGQLRTTKNGKTGCWVRTLCAEEAVNAGYDIEEWERKMIEKNAKNEQTEKN